MNAGCPHDILNFYEKDVAQDPPATQARYAWADLLLYLIETYGNRLFANHRVQGEWRSWTVADLVALALEVADHLKERGICAGDRVAVLSESRPEFLAHFLGVGLAGACLVPVDPKLSLPEMSRIL